MFTDDRPHFGRPGMHTLYLASQQIAAQEEPVFALGIDDAQRAALRTAGVVAGDMLCVVDAAQDFFTCQVVDPGIPTVRIAARPAPSTPSVYLLQGLCEFAVMDTVVRQAAELGVRGFAPFSSTYSKHPDPARAASACAHWGMLAQIAALQAGYAEVPAVDALRTLDDTCALLSRFDAVVVCWERERCRSMAAAAEQLRAAGLDRAGDIALVVGPRGGLTDYEMSQLSRANEQVLTVTLGPAVLRVETAGVVAPALLISGLGGLA
jgi:16S rRNA (uracil1498-N3)-methyltransferase